MLFTAKHCQSFLNFVVMKLEKWADFKDALIHVIPLVAVWSWFSPIFWRTVALNVPVALTPLKSIHFHKYH